MRSRLALILLLASISPAEDAQLARIQHSIQAGDLAAARSQLQEALKASPADPRLYNFLGVVDVQEWNIAAAETDFRRAIEIAPRFIGAYLNLGHLYQEKHEKADLEKGLDVYRRLLRFDPKNEEALYQSAMLLNRLGKFAPSLESLARLPAGAQQRAAAVSLRCANQARLGQDASASSSASQLMTAQDLTTADVLPLVPLVAKPVARKLLETLVQRGLGSAPALIELGTLYDQQHEYKRARETLEKALPESGQPPVSLLNLLAKVTYESGNLEGALGYLAHARDIEPDNASIHYLFGLICIDLKLPPEAKQSLLDAVRLDSSNPFYHYALAAVLLQEKNPEGAIPHLKRFCQLRPDDPSGRFALGVAYFDAYQLDLAREEFLTIVDHRETSAGAHLYLGRLALRDEKLEEAAEQFHRAIEANPSAAEPYAELGLVEIHRRQYGLAGKALERAVELAPESYRPNLNLLLLYERTKDPRAAEQVKRVERLQKAGEERERMLLRSLAIRPY